jgi:hypothetical protein
MSFFDSFPQPPPPEPARHRPPAWARPETVIPGSVAAGALLIRTEDVAVAAASVRAYPNGFEFTVHVRLRRDDPAGPGPDPFGWHGRGAGAPGDLLRLGVVFADGRQTATTAASGPSEDDAERLLLQQNGGGGGSLSWDADFWVHPLPPDGPVTLVASWLAHGIAEARAELDGTAIRQAARQAVILWPDEPDARAGDTDRQS